MPRRLAFSLALVVTTALTASAALACKPAPRPPEAPVETRPVTTPAPEPTPIPALRPWTEADTKRADALLDEIAGLVETLGGAQGDPRVVLARWFTQRGTSVDAFVASLREANRDFGGDRPGMAAYTQSRVGRIQRLAEDMQKLSPETIQVIGELFTRASARQ